MTAAATSEADAAAEPQAPAGKGLTRRALSLGAANAVDYGLQFLLPVVLTRCLDAEAFGQYRLLWLAAGTVLAVITLSVPGSLYYYLPRSNAEEKRLYINQTLLFLVVAGAIAAWAVSAWNPWLPQLMRGLAPNELIVPAFVLLWVVSWLLDLLPTVEERVSWQAKAIVGLSALRAIALSLAAWVTGDLTAVLLVLLAFVAIKVAILLGYVAKYHGLRGPLMRTAAFADQLRHAAPFVAAAALYGLQAQADQWVAASLFPVAMFAAFSIAGVLAPMVNICRQSINFTFLPTMSRAQAAGDLQGMVDLNSRANVMVGTLVYPLLAFAFVFAEEIVTVVYTAAYVDAAQVMRIYIIGLAALVVELASVMLLLRQGPFQLVMSLILLVVSVGLSWFGAHRFGLPGAALGSVSVIFIDRYATLARIALQTGIPLRRLQDWRSLALWILFAVLAALFAWSMVAAWFAASGAFVRVMAGGIFMAGAYGLLQGLFGIGRERLYAAVAGWRR
jgi:O-antigen/teichoic acid export membrane protein